MSASFWCYWYLGINGESGVNLNEDNTKNEIWDRLPEWQNGSTQFEYLMVLRAGGASALHQTHFFTLSQYQTDSGYTTLPSLTFIVSLFLHPPWKSTSFFTSQSPSGQSWITASEQVLQDSYGRGSESRIFQYLPMYLLATIFTYLVILTK